ncbi:TPA: hypothetical protein N0F65_008369 [Lagenidium giganteum]|uniref:Ankyrin repeat protein n=1 Tax=Lagenidium giganteum TaxID=4803 RepID=A0AAV2Z0F6_9STRA|nr:TPA: hypothetical protein N0F65_008369 [Lagenidium giganteum]
MAPHVHAQRDPARAPTKDKDRAITNAIRDGRAAEIAELMKTHDARCDGGQVIDCAVDQVVRNKRVERQQALAVVDTLLAHGARGAGAAPALFRAASVGDTQLVRLLLRHGVAADTTLDDAGTTALHAAVMARSLPTVALLVEAGADVHAGAKHGQAPLALCAQAGDVDVWKFLVANGADASTSSFADGRTCLDIAAEYHHQELLEHICRPNCGQQR